MKTVIKKIATGFLLSVSMTSLSQNNIRKESLSVINIDTKGVNVDPSAMGDMARIEIDKLDTFDVKDKYDILQFMEKNKLGMTNCYGKSCLTELGLMLKSDKMFTGTVEQLARTIVISFRMIDVKRSMVEKTYVHEYLYLPEEVRSMVKLSIAEMFGRPVDNNLMKKLSKPNEFDNAINNPKQERLRLDGPRMGFVGFSGELLNRIQAPKNQGGFDAFPAMFQFGYQFEKQYLNEGKAQALFEFLPMITGLDQGYFIPSITILHGLRSNVNGWEFAFGPTFNFMPMANGYFDQSNQWQLEDNWHKDGSNQGINNPFDVRQRIDSRGTYTLHSSFILAFGRTFKSGKLNIPVNAFIIPGRDGWRFGVSFGFNAKNK